MPRILSNESLLKRGARFGDEPVAPLAEKKPEAPAASPLVGAVKIDTTPIAEAVRQLSDVVKTALESQAPLLKQIAEQQLQGIDVNKPPEVWDFEIKRDARGRMESIRARAVA